MTKFITLLIGASLALAVAAPAKQAEQKNKQSKPAQQQQVAPKQSKAPKAPKPQAQAMPKTPKKQERTMPAVQSEKPANVQSKKVRKDKSQAPGPNAVADDKLRKNLKVRGAHDEWETNGQTQKQLTTSKVKVKPEKVKEIKAKHVNFQAKPNPAITTAQFNPNYRIEAAQNWTGPQYNVFRVYQPQWHDRTWWSSHYTTVSLIAGGWYFWDAGYWYPAWGYDDSAAYYPYDGPIYVGSSPRPFDQVVADVQSILQEEGYYRGEVDGLVGPLTREALAAYQNAQGLAPTAAIDQPTLESLGIG